MKNRGISRKIIVYVLSILTVAGGIMIIVYSKIDPYLIEGNSSVMAGIFYIIVGLLLIFLAK